MAAEWAALLQARHHSPRLCEVNARSPRAASLLALWPHASYLGLSFNHTASTAWRLPPRAAIAAGDRHRTVRAAPELAECEVLLLDTDDPRPARGRNLLLDDLPNALQRVARRQHTLVVEGAACARGGPRRAAQGWCGAWEELVSRGLVRPLRCGGGASGGERAAWCAGEVALGSACERRAPLLEGGGGAEGWAAEEVRLDLRGKSWRYFSVFECGESAASEEVCLIFKDHVFEAWVGGWQSQDGLAFEGKPALVMPVTWPHARMTHNMALLRDGRGYVIVGGQYKIASAARCGKRAGHFVPCAKDLPPYNGVWMSRGASWRFAAAGRRNIRATAPLQSIVDFGHGTPSQWSRPQFLFNGTHPGCVERRIRYFASLARLGECEFDGRLSLVRLRGTLLLYARANPAAHGQRFVQVAASTDEGASWSAFSLISLAGYRYPQGDLYFFSVQPNPAANGSLLALFPIVHKFRGCVGMAVSEDGVRWSAITPLLRCAVHGERTVHHPVAGVLRRGDAAHVYIHHNVPGVTADVSPSSRAKAEFPYLDLPPTKLVRYTIPLKALHSWTMESMMSLKR